MLTSPDSTFSTTVFEWLNVTRRFETFRARLFHAFREHGNFRYRIFSHGLWQHVHGVVGSLIATLLQIS